MVPSTDTANITMCHFRHNRATASQQRLSSEAVELKLLTLLCQQWLQLVTGYFNETSTQNTISIISHTRRANSAVTQ